MRLFRRHHGKTGAAGKICLRRVDVSERTVAGAHGANDGIAFAQMQAGAAGCVGKLKFILRFNAVGRNTAQVYVAHGRRMLLVRPLRGIEFAQIRKHAGTPALRNQAKLRFLHVLLRYAVEVHEP